MPVLAEEETSRINVMGSASFGKPMASAIGDKKLQRISKAPLGAKNTYGNHKPIKCREVFA